jgi:plasmid stability protein
MPAVTIRNLPEATHRALKARAKKHGRSTEAEVRLIIETAVRPADRVRLGSELAELGRKYGGIDLQIERDQTPTPPVRL